MIKDKNGLRQRSNGLRSRQNGLRAFLNASDVLGKMICALICAWFARWFAQTNQVSVWRGANQIPWRDGVDRQTGQVCWRAGWVASVC
jgi:hypothetical protein